MVDILIISMASACILTAVEGLLISLGKFRGLLALGASIGGFLSLGIKTSYLPVYGLAATFGGLTLSLFVELIFTEQPTAVSRRLPNRIPPL